MSDQARYALLLIEFDPDTPDDGIADFAFAMKKQIEGKARWRGVVRVLVQAPEVVDVGAVTEEFDISEALTTAVGWPQRPGIA